MIKTSRRNFLGASAVISLAPAPISAQSPEGETIRQDLFRYLNFGNKQAGGDGDVACGNWLASELAKAGYAVERQYYQVPFFEPLAAELECEGGSVPVYPQPVVVPTGAGGLAGPLVRVDGYGQFAGSMKAPLRSSTCRMRDGPRYWHRPRAHRLRRPLLRERAQRWSLPMVRRAK